MSLAVLDQWREVRLDYLEGLSHICSAYAPGPFVFLMDLDIPRNSIRIILLGYFAILYVI